MSTGQEVLRILERYRLKREGDQWRCDSPLRANSDSHSFVVRIEPDGEHGAFYDHVSGESGSLYELAQKLGVPLPERTPVQSTKRTYSGLEDYARAHGLTAEQLAAAGWSFVTKDGRPALQFTTRTGLRWRFLDGEKPVYKSQPGYQRCWYGLDRAVALAKEKGVPLVLCNGEISTVTAHAYGVPACCITGGENAAVPPDLLDLLLAKWSGEVLVAYDCLDKGAKAAPQVAKQLRESGLNARAIDLKLGKGGDLADFCMLHQPEPLAALLRCPELPQQVSTPMPHVHIERPILHESELDRIPKVEWYLKSELPTTGLTVIFGPSGSGKSFLAIDYAQRLAQHVPVVYVAAEGESGMKLRAGAWRQHHKAPYGKLYFHLGAVWMWDDSDVQLFIQRIQSIAPKVVIIDTLSQCLQGSDSDDREIRQFIRAAQLIQHAINGLVIIIHHTGWSTTARERGSSVLRAACDTMIRVVLEDDTIRVESSKTKDAEPFPTRFMKLLPVVSPEGESRVIVEADLLLLERDARPTPNQQKVLEFLALEDVETGASRQEVAAATEVPLGSLSRIFSSLIKRGYVEKMREGHTSLYKLTESGRDALQFWQEQDKMQQALQTPVQMPSDTAVPPVAPMQPVKRAEPVPSPQPVETTKSALSSQTDSTLEPARLLDTAFGSLPDYYREGL